MRIVAKVLLIIVLTAAVATLVAALTVHWPALEYSEPAEQTGLTNRGIENLTIPDPQILADPLSVSKAFGYSPPVPRKMVPTQPEPEVIPETPVAKWIQSVGFVTTGEGTRRYVLKITSPIESIVSLEIGESADGILLVAIEENTLVIEREKERYLVPLPPR